MVKFILTIVIFTIALHLKDVSSNICTSQQTCGKCISENTQCAWCSQENFADNASPRCDFMRNFRKRDCNPEYIHAPVSHMEIVEDREIGHHWGSAAIHIRPQEIKIKLTPNSVRRFLVEFRQIEDYPLDLYFLLDLSTADNAQKMVQLGYKLAEELPKITSDFRIGFGTFVQKQRNSCPTCRPSYSFKNVMKLSSDTKRFAHMIEEVPDSVNLNAPDGRMDVIMKAIVCKDKIGWRENSRKILLYASDSYYNYPAHGQLDNLKIHNAKFCKLDRNGYFIKSNEDDFTSLNQIKNHIRKNEMHIIFAVTRHKRTLYLNLSRNLNNSSVGTFDGDLSQIIDLIREQYDNIRSSVKIEDSLHNDNIKLTYYSKCRGSKLRKTNHCDGLKKGSKVTFEIEMELDSCPSEHMERIRKFDIYPVGLHANLIVDLEVKCECDCEKPENKIERSLKCSGTGTFECGACTCNKYKYGSKCECDVADIASRLGPYWARTCKNTMDARTMK